MQLVSYAKINLYLEVLEKLDSGYHNINSIMHQINLFDELEFEILDTGEIEIECSDKSLENDKNIAFKTTFLIKNQYQIDEGIKIKIKKNIPIGGGLAGGSGNAAATIKAMDELFNLNLTQDQMLDIGIQIGSDVPFQLIGGTCLVGGIGDEIQELDNISNINFIIINPGIDISTKWAYKEFDKLHEKNNLHHINKIINAINNNNINLISHNLFNDFELFVFNKFREIKEIKMDLIKYGALNSLMSGSGSTVFGIFENDQRADICYDKLKDKYPFVMKTTSK